jgi:hypothetical protein
MRNAANVPYMFYVTDSRQDTVVHLHVTEWRMIEEEGEEKESMTIRLL